MWQVALDRLRKKKIEWGCDCQGCAFLFGISPEERQETECFHILVGIETDRQRATSRDKQEYQANTGDDRNAAQLARPGKPLLRCRLAPESDAHGQNKTCYRAEELPPTQKRNVKAWMPDRIGEILVVLENERLDRKSVV